MKNKYPILIAVRFLIVLCTVALAGHAFAQEQGKIFNAETFMLENGMQIVVIPNHRAPVVTHMVWYKVGAAEETQGKSGIAHFMEHLMFKGSEGLAPGEFSEKVRALGGNDNAFTSQDYTAYHQSISTKYLETVMRMEAGRMRGMNPPEEEVLSERKVILEERSQRIDNNPRAKFGEALSAALFSDHPYGIPIIGWEEEMRNLSRDDAMAFYNKWYGPNNAVLIVSGDVTGEQIYTLAKDIYGPIPPIPPQERIRSAAPPPELRKDMVILEHPGIRQPMFQKIFRMPSYRQNPEDSLAMQVLTDIMSGGPTSRLYKALVVEQKIASSAGLSYNSSSWDNSTVWVYGAPVPGQSLETIEEALNSELRKLAEEGVSEEELGDALSRMQSEAIYARDSLSGPAMIFGRALTTGSSIDDVEYWPDNIAKVTAEQIQKVAKKYIHPDTAEPDRVMTGHLLPEKPQEQTPEQSAEQKEESTE